MKNIYKISFSVCIILLVARFVRIPIMKTPSEFNKVYVINLERSPDRKAYMEKQLNRIGVNYEFFKAVDGKDLKFINEKGEVIVGLDINNKKRLGETYKILCPTVTLTYTHKDIDAPFGAGVAGCYCSHLEVLKKAYADGNKVSVVLEDDIDLSAVNLNKLNSLKGALIDSKPSIIYLGLPHRKSVGIGRKLKTFKYIPFSNLRRLSHSMLQVHAYSITKDGVSSLFHKLVTTEVGGIDYRLFQVTNDGIKDGTIKAYKANNIDIWQNKTITTDMLN